jgi:hypothetical protein
MPSADEGRKIAYKKPNYIDVGIFIVLTLTLGGVWWYAYEAHRQNGLAVYTIQCHLRPWILLEEISPDFWPRQAASFRNVGNTPAERLDIYLRCDRLSNPPQPGFEKTMSSDQRSEITTTVVDPDGETKAAVGCQVPVPPGTVAYYYGFASYADQFGMMGGLVFCRFLDKKTGWWRDCPEGNIAY